MTMYGTQPLPIANPIDWHNPMYCACLGIPIMFGESPYAKKNSGVLLHCELVNPTKKRIRHLNDRDFQFGKREKSWRLEEGVGSLVHSRQNLICSIPGRLPFVILFKTATFLTARVRKLLSWRTDNLQPVHKRNSFLLENAHNLQKKYERTTKNTRKWMPRTAIKMKEQETSVHTNCSVRSCFGFTHPVWQKSAPNPRTVETKRK